LVSSVGEAVLTRELGRDRRLQLGYAVDVRVLGLAATNGFDRRQLDVLRRVEVRLSGPEADHIAALALQLPRAGGDGQCGRRLDPGQGGGLKRDGLTGHGDSGRLRPLYAVAKGQSNRRLACAATQC